MATCARAGTWEMSLRIEDYALIGNTRTAALVGRDGSIDWLCMPRFDSGACFAALLGDRENGRWLLAPRGKIRKVRRHYRESTLVLETEFETSEGVVAISDFMPIQESGEQVDLVRIVEGRKGTVSMRMEAVFRFDYGSIVPWVRRRDHGISAIAGPDAVGGEVVCQAVRPGLHLRVRPALAFGHHVLPIGERVCCCFEEIGQVERHRALVEQVALRAATYRRRRRAPGRHDPGGGVSGAWSGLAGLPFTAATAASR